MVKGVVKGVAKGVHGTHLIYFHNKTVHQISVERRAGERK
jgi:hypothetical protein